MLRKALFAHDFGENIFLWIFIIFKKNPCGFSYMKIDFSNKGCNFSCIYHVFS